MPNSDKFLLQNINFKLEPGQALAVIGPTGAGKSTLARAIVGIVPLARGAVRLDGATPNQFGEDKFGRLIGYLPQEVQIFDGTVAENISRFDPEVDDAKIIEAAKAADIHEYILRLPQDYGTPLLEGGSRLSAGHRQRLALARALYNNPVLLVLDEPNSNLDQDGDAALEKAIKASMLRGASVVIIAHRINVLNSVTHVAEIHQGQLKVFSTRDEFITKLRQQNLRLATPQQSH